jgi:hypothetical protein
MVDDPQEQVTEQADEEARVPPSSFEQVVLHQDFKGFAQLPLKEIAERAKAVSVPEDVMDRARAKLQAHTR